MANELFYILFFILSYTYSTSQFGLATVHMLGRHMWAEATVLDRTGVKLGFSKQLL